MTQDLLNPVPETLLPADPAQPLLDAGDPAREVAASHPTSSAAWAALAEAALAADRVIEGYAFARVGYHRGLDLLGRNDWRPVPWEHEPNRGWLRCLHHLAVAAALMGESDEAHRCREFLRESSATAYTTLGH